MGESGKSAFYITTAISYVNGAPHLGHAYEAISCDVIARFKRLDGYDVRFLTGTDEHGQKVAKTAEKAGKSPRVFCNEIASQFQEMCTLLQITNNDFIRTTEERHKQSCQALWRKLADAGDIYRAQNAENILGCRLRAVGCVDGGAPVGWRAIGVDEGDKGLRDRARAVLEQARRLVPSREDDCGVVGKQGIVDDA